jgi:hypothetical protein
MDAAEIRMMVAVFGIEPTLHYAHAARMWRSDC